MTRKKQTDYNITFIEAQKHTFVNNLYKINTQSFNEAL